MKSLYLKGSIMLGIVALSFTACKKEIKDDTAVVFSTEENAQAGETFSDSFIDISSFSTENDVLFSSTNNSTLPSTDGNPEISVTTTAGADWPKIVTFDYKTGITKNGVTKKGKIQAVYSNRFLLKRSIITVSFIDYYVNSHKIEGTKIITNNGLNAPGNFTFSVVVSKSKITSPTASFSYDATHTIEWTAGVGTSRRLDDEFSITGSSSGTSSKGFTFTTNILKPLIKKVAWTYIVAGKVQIIAGDLERVLDYGNGALDARATYTYIGGPVVEIFLRK